MFTPEVADTVHATEAYGLYPCPDDMVASKVRFAHSPMVDAALTVTIGTAGLLGDRMVFEAVIAVGFSGHEVGRPMQNDRSNPPSMVKVSPILA